MKKPLNKFALLLWAIAVVMAAYNMWSIYNLFQTVSELPPGAHANIMFGSAWRTVSAVLVQSSVLISLGVLIEMVDQIRGHVTRTR